MRHWLLKVLLIAIAPLLMAPHCMKSITPTFPTDPLNPPPPAGGFQEWQENVEPMLNDAQANTVLSLGISDWSAIEDCELCEGTDCEETDPRFGWPAENAGHERENKDGDQKWICTYNFLPLHIYLTVHANPFGVREDRRHIIVQLAPIFFLDRTTPPYLAEDAFNSTRMKTAYFELLNALQEVLETYHVGQDFDDPLVLIGLGNEVNAHLNSLPLPTLAWEAYTEFVEDAIAYINNNWTSIPHVPFVSTMYYGSCGFGDVVWDTGWCNDPNGQLGLWNRAFNLMSSTGTFVMTYYPYPVHNQNAGLVWVDMLFMAIVASSELKPVLLQEVGYPTGKPAVPVPPALPFSEWPDPAATQTEFVNVLFQGWADFSDFIWAINYHTLHDFDAWVFPTGFFDKSGASKPQSDWSNFTQKMAAAP